MMKKIVAVLLAMVMVGSVAPLVVADSCSRIEITGPKTVMDEKPFDITLTVLNATETGPLTTYGKNVTINASDDCLSILMKDLNGDDLDPKYPANWTSPSYKYEFRPGDNGVKTFTVMLNTDEASTTRWIYAAGENADDETLIDQFGELKIAVAQTEGDSIKLVVDLVPLIDFEVGPSAIDFGKMSSCCSPHLGDEIQFTNRGAKDLLITALVDEEPFVQGVYLNNGADILAAYDPANPANFTEDAAQWFWTEFDMEVPSDHDDYQSFNYTDIVLKIPENFGDDGTDVEGTIIFFAEVAPSET